MSFNRFLLKKIIILIVSASLFGCGSESREQNLVVSSQAQESSVQPLEELSSALEKLQKIDIDSVIPLYRLYNPVNGEHLYTQYHGEYLGLKSFGWIQENIAFYTLNSVSSVGSVTAIPWLRVYNPNNGLHHWTTSQAEYDALGELGWNQESASGYFFDVQVSGSAPLYRLYNPNNGTHHWTLDLNERNVLIHIGWNDEGIAGYVYNNIADAEVDDYSGDQSTGGLISIDDNATGTIESLSDTDWFKVELVAGTTYVFTMNSSELSSSYISLYGSTGRLLESDYRSSSEFNAEFSYQPTNSGNYYLSASQLGHNEVGSYTVGASIGNTDDYANNVTTTGSLSVDSDTTGTIENLSDTDWFKVELIAGTTYVFTMNSSELSSSYISLYGSTGRLLESDYQSSSEFNAEFSYQPTTSGAYYLSASQLGDDEAGSYTVGASIGNTDDYADNVTTTGSLSVNSDTTGTIENLSDTDWFKVELIAGTTYVFTMTSSEFSSSYIRLYGSNGSSLESDYQSSNEFNAEFSYQPITSGAYYLSASQLGDDEAGSYTVGASIGNTDDYANNVTTTGSLSVNSDTTGTIENLSDTDWFKVELIAGTTYVFTMTSSEFSSSYIRLYGSTGSSLESDYQSSNEFNAEFSYQPITSGAYYLSASQLGDDEAGSYTVGASIGNTDDYANNVTTTGSLSVDSDTTGTIENLSDTDWFKVELIAGTTYVFTMNSSELSSSYIRLYGSTGSSLESDYQSSSEFNAEFSYQPTTSGAYYLSASQLGDDETGSYILGASSI